MQLDVEVWSNEKFSAEIPNTCVDEYQRDLEAIATEFSVLPHGLVIPKVNISLDEILRRGSCSLFG